MPAVKNVLKHVRVEQAKARRKCGRNRAKHVITKGENCLVIQDGQDSPSYCLECAKPILALAQGQLDEIMGLLDIVNRIEKPVSEKANA